MNPKVRRARQIEYRLSEIAQVNRERGGLTSALRDEVSALVDEFDSMDLRSAAVDAMRGTEVRADVDGHAGLLAGLRSGRYGTEPRGDEQPRNPWLASQGRPALPGTRGEAMRTLDEMERAGADRSGLAQYARMIEIETDDMVDPDEVARYLVAAGSPAYASSFAKAFRAAAISGNPAMAALTFTDDERQAWIRAQEYANRAISLGGSGGGILVPAQLDPAVILTNTGDSEADEIRRVASVRTTTSSVYRAVTSAGVTATFAAELAEAVDGAPALASVDITVHKAHCWVPFSVELEQDAGGDLLNAIGVMFRDARGRLEADRFVNGTGTGEVWGMAARLVQAAKTRATAAPDVVALGDIYGLKGDVPDRWRRDGSWLISDLALDAVRRLGEGATGNASHLVEGLADGAPSRLLGRPLTESTALDKPGKTAAAGNDDVAIYGDLSQYVIADRIGSQVEFASMVMGPNGRPIGARGLYFWFRVGADFVVPDAARLLRA